MANFAKISFVYPQAELTNDQLSKEFPEWSIEKIGRKIGINTRYISDESDTALSLSKRACEKLFAEYQIDKNTVDFILLCTQSPDYTLPTTACLLQNELNLNKNIGALDFNLGCSGFIYGLAMSKGLIQTKVAQNVLLVMAETYTKYINKSDKGNRSIFGDAASAILISEQDINALGEFVLGTDGSGGKNLIVHNSGSQKDESVEPEKAGCLFMDGPEIFNFTVDIIPNLVEQILLKNHLGIDQIDFFVFHQANKYILDFLRVKMNLNSEKFIIDIEDGGNTVSSTIPIALKKLILNKSPKSGTKVMLVGFGVGYSYGGTVIDI